jgi:hypothetical protein
MGTLPTTNRTSSLPTCHWRTSLTPAPTCAMCQTMSLSRSPDLRTQTRSHFRQMRECAVCALRRERLVSAATPSKTTCGESSKAAQRSVRQGIRSRSGDSFGKAPKHLCMRAGSFDRWPSRLRWRTGRGFRLRTWTCAGSGGERGGIPEDHLSGPRLSPHARARSSGLRPQPNRRS